MPDQTWQEMFDEAGEADKPIPDGDYPMVVQSVEAKMTGNKKKMYVMRCAVENGEYAKRVVFNNQVVSPESQGAMQVFFRQMAALGLGKDFWSQNPDDAKIVAALTGRRFTVTLGHREYQGIERNEFKAIKAPSAAVGANAAPPPPGAPGAAAPPPPPPPAGAPAAPPPPAAAPANTPPPPAPQAAPPAPAAPQAPAAPAAPQEAPAPAPAPAAPAPEPNVQTEPAPPAPTPEPAAAPAPAPSSSLPDAPPAPRF